LTATDEVNLLATTEFAEAFGSEHVYRLASREIEVEPGSEPAVARRRGRVLFNERVTYDEVDRLFRKGAEIRTLELTSDEVLREFKAHSDDIIPMFYVREEQLWICSTDQNFTPRLGDTVVYAIET
jgi:hypothetical protein